MARETYRQDPVTHELLPLDEWHRVQEKRAARCKPLKIEVKKVERGTWRYDPKTGEHVTIEEWQKRQDHKKTMPARPEWMPKTVEKGRWIQRPEPPYELVPADEWAGKYGTNKTRSGLAAPQVISDIEPYRSTVDGSYIGGRKQHRDHLKAHGCVEVGNEWAAMTKKEKAKLPRAGHDIKEAFERLSTR